MNDNYGTGAVGGGGMTDTEYRSHFAMWAIMAAPLIAGNDISNMNQATKDNLMNPEVIAVDQDSMGNQGVLVNDTGGLQVYSKLLQTSGTRAIVLLNRTGAAANMTVNFSTVGLGAMHLVVIAKKHIKFVGFLYSNSLGKAYRKNCRKSFHVVFIKFQVSI